MDEERAKQAIRDGEAAWVEVSSGSWHQSSWSRIGTALTLMRAQVLHQLGLNKARGGKYNDAFSRRIAETKFATMEPVTRSNLLFLMEPENRIVLDALLAKWPPDLRARRTHPITLAKYVKAELKPPKPAPAPKPSAKGATAQDAENERLRKRVSELEAALAAAKAAPAAKAVPFITDRELTAKYMAAVNEVHGLRAKLAAATKPPSETEKELRTARAEAAMLREENKRLKAKPPKVKLDPESEAAHEVERVKALNAELRRRIAKLKSALPHSMRARIAKALNESTSTPALRKETLQGWNGLGLNGLF